MQTYSPCAQPYYNGELPVYRAATQKPVRTNGTRLKRVQIVTVERSQKYKYSFCAYSNSPMTSAKCDFPQKNANLCNQGPPICTRLEHARQILALPVLIFANFCVGFVLLKYTTRDPKSKHPPDNNRASTHLQCYLAVHMYSSTCSLYDILQSTRWCNQRRAVDKASDHCAVQQTSSSARCRSFMQFSWIN